MHGVVDCMLILRKVEKRGDEECVPVTPMERQNALHMIPLIAGNAIL
jgi:hypothetical protein